MLKHSDQLDKAFHALADSNRRAMIAQLSHGDASVSDLATPLGISLPAVLQHLSILEDSGIVVTRKIGRKRNCTLDTNALSRAEEWINSRRTFWNQQLDSLGEFLQTTDSNATIKDDRNDR